MSMQIHSIVLYNLKGEKRILSFKLGEVNVITGKSQTGKSTIINIVEYCLGRSDFRVPEGPIRETVSWYGVLYQIKDTQVFIAKPSPKLTARSQSEVYYEVGAIIEIPDLQKLKVNSNDDAVVEYLTRLIGISPNLNIPKEKESRLPLEASLKHTHFYLFQRQNVIANPDQLFHRQTEPFMPQTIKDTLPYFLGAVREDKLKLIEELRIARRNLKLAEKKLKEAELIAGKTVNTGSVLILEAQQVGLVEPNFKSEDPIEIVEKLKTVLGWNSDSIPQEMSDKLPSLQTELTNIRQNFRKLSNQIRSAEMLTQEITGYTSEASEHKMRLDAINLYESDGSNNEHCPLCSSKVVSATDITKRIKSSIISLSAHIETADRERPRLREYIKMLKKQREDLRQQIQEIEQDILAIQSENEVAIQIRESNARVARVVGRISLYLENVNITEEDSQLRRNVEKCDQIVTRLENQLDPEESGEVQASILNLIGFQMTEWAKDLKLEHAGYPYRLDLTHLTVVADRPGRPISMARGAMGSGQNWLGCHLITLLSLHKYFVEQKRPVPNFLFIDQPSQVYFPEDRYLQMEGKKEELTDDDRSAVSKMFNLLSRVCKDLFPNFQIIVMEHANLDEEEFQKALVEKPWREKQALIPQRWYD